MTNIPSMFNVFHDVLAESSTRSCGCSPGGEDLLDDTAPEAGGQRLLRRGTNAPADRCRRSAIFAAAFAIFAAAGRTSGARFAQVCCGSKECGPVRIRWFLAGSTLFRG